MIKYALKGTLYNYETWDFPAGEVGVRIFGHAAPHSVANIRIDAALTSSDEIMRLFMVTDALHRQFPLAKLHLVLGYMPYGRQDRKCVEGESLSLAVICKLINAQEYERVTIIDPHSDVTPALLDNCEVMSQDEVFHMAFSTRFGKVGNAQRVLVAPDAGAAKKAAVIADRFRFADVLYAVKKRELSTGKITGLSLSGDVSGKNVVVVDDICDGGKTFTELAAILDGAGATSKALVVTHGIFSKGHEVLTEAYDSVYTTNTYHMDRVGNVEGVIYRSIF